MRNHRAPRDLETIPPLYEHTATAGPMRRPSVRRALAAAQASGLVTRWREPAPGYYLIESPHAELEISPAR